MCFCLGTCVCMYVVLCKISGMSNRILCMTLKCLYRTFLSCDEFEFVFCVVHALS